MTSPSEHAPRTIDLIETALRGELSAHDSRQLQQLLLEDDEAGRIYLDYAQLHADIHLLAREIRAHRSVEERLGSGSGGGLPSGADSSSGSRGGPEPPAVTPQAPAPIAPIAPIAPTEPTDAGPGFFPALWAGFPSAIDWRTHPIRFTLLVAAIVGASWGVLTAMVGSVRVEPQPQHAAKPEPVPEPEVDAKAPLALLRQYDETLWSDGAEGMPSIGRGNFAGDTLDLEEGLARFEFKDGAQIVIEGPCRITFERHNAARLHRGKLAALVKTPSAHGFVVDTPFATVTDLGTEFGVAVCDEAAEVEVYPPVA